MQKFPCVQAILGCSKSLVLQKSPSPAAPMTEWENDFGGKRNRWEPIVSAMSKKKLHTYCVFETPNPYESRVVTGQFQNLQIP